MRVALACPYAWDDAGGVQTHVRELAERLRARGHDVLVLAPARSEPSQPWVLVAGKPVDVTFNASNAPVDPRPWSRAAVRHALAAFGPDVVHAHEPLAPSTGLWAVLEARCPVVGTFHSGVGPSRLYDLAGPVLRRIARRLGTRIAVSRAAADTARRRIGGSFEVVPNGVDTERFAHAAPRDDLGPGTKLLFVGRLDERKGFPLAVAAFERLAAERDALRMIVAGDGPQRGAVDTLPAPVRERVRMLGHVPNIELPPYMAACDVYLGASIGGESFGIVLAEAMAAGVPVIASDVPGYDEVVEDGVSGLLVPPRNAGALAAAAARILDDPGLAASLADGGRQRARTFDWSGVVERLEGIYERATDAGPPSLR